MDLRLSRRRMLQVLGTGALMSPGCRRAPEPKPLVGEIMGNHAPVGHRLWSPSLPEPAETVRRSVLIVGGGIAGLSAAWRLRHAGVDDLEVVELAPEAGGTARGGRGEVSAYPWGAHYLPAPNPEATLVRRLCDEIGLIRDGRPDERQLVFEPEDRLFFRGQWYDGLYLSAGASDADLAQFERFQRAVTELRDAVGADGRPAFAIPAPLSSRDPEFRALDAVTMTAWLDQRGFDSERLRWFIDYGCRDDYGAGIDAVSAWAGLHYFAGRRPLRSPETRGTHYFTWPEGNARLVAFLRERVPHLTTDRVVLRVRPDGTAVAWDVARERAVGYKADHIVVATPNHVTERLTGGERPRFATHAPWLVANLTLRQRPPTAEPAWNNVLFESGSLGYVEARHQTFGPSEPTVWTWYTALPTDQRRSLLTGSWQDLAKQPLNDLRAAYGDLRPRLSRLDVWRWGHGTIIPAPGLHSGATLAAARRPLGRVRFAHTDLSGLPLFEEAQYQGVRAAEEVLDALKVAGPRWC